MSPMKIEACTSAPATSCSCANLVYMDPLDLATQPICPACGVTTYPEDDADVCRECGYRIEWPAAEHPGMGGDIPEIRT